MNCKDCKNWESEDESDFGGCKVSEECHLQYWDGLEMAKNKIKHGSFGGDNLYTHKNFGCILFEK